MTDSNIGGRGGAEQHLAALVTHLDRLGFEIRVLQLAQVVPQEKGKIGRAVFGHLPAGRLLSLHGLGRTAEIHRIVRNGNYQCILSYFESSDLIAAAVGLFNRTTALISSRRDTGFRHSDKVRWAYRVIDKRFAFIIAASNAIKQSLLANGVREETIRLVYNGVDAVKFDVPPKGSLRRELGIPDESMVLGTVAELAPVKDQRNLLASVRVIHDAGHAVHLVLAGDGPLREDLQRLTAELRLGDYVHFLGLRSDVPQILADIDVFVLSSLTEGLSNALLEAMAAGKAVVATGVGGNLEVVVDGVTGLLVPPGQPQALSGAITRLIRNPMLRLSMAAAGRDRARAFPIEAMVAGYVQAIEQAVGKQAEGIASLSSVAR
ncbi:MAG: glycosyltransferase [Gammaproteobacteria bacterium]